MKKGLRRVLALIAVSVTLVTSGIVLAQPTAPSPAPRPDGAAPMIGQAPPTSTPLPLQRGFFGGSPGSAFQNRDLGSALTVYAIVFSPGEEPFYKFGHNAIWIHDVSGRNPMLRDRVYNYGTFSFDDPALLPKFVLGRFMYWLSPAPIGWTKAAYAAEGRGIIAQELDLTSAQKLELQQKLEENLLDENKYYKYDYYRDNCSTRVRDMLDSVLGGRIKAASTAPAALTYRQETSRLTASLPPEEIALSLAMGDFIDKPVTLWEQEFIPMELQKVLRTVTVPGPDGVDKPLVKREFVLVPTDKPDPPLAPPVWWPYSLVAGVFFGGAFALLGRLGKKHRFARVLFGVSLASWGLLLGFFGTFFVFVWAFTDHVAGYHNENIFLCAPWAIVLTGTGIRVAMNRVKSILFAYRLVSAALLFAVIGLAIKVLPWFDQKNAFFLVFFIPFWIGATYGIRELREQALLALAAVQGTSVVLLPRENESVEAPVEKKKTKAKTKKSASEVSKEPLVPVETAQEKVEEERAIEDEIAEGSPVDQSAADEKTAAEKKSDEPTIDKKAEEARAENQAEKS